MIYLDQAATSFPKIKEVQDAGVQVVMMTGDRKETAKSIAIDCGILKDNDILRLANLDFRVVMK